MLCVRVCACMCVWMVRVDGACRLEAVLDRVRQNISLDLLSRVLADLHQDSSKLIDSLVRTSPSASLVTTQLVLIIDVVSLI